ncbi:MAG: response regulator [Acidobacteria bacterium]|nr:MAG: response regulator [Acidobacteriota bacterium]
MLVVEDDPDLRRLVALHAEDLGCDVAPAEPRTGTPDTHKLRYT